MKSGCGARSPHQLLAGTLLLPGDFFLSCLISELIGSPALPASLNFQGKEHYFAIITLDITPALGREHAEHMGSKTNSFLALEIPSHLHGG